MGDALVAIIAVPFGCMTTVALGMLIFPSTREALASWVQRKGVDGPAGETAKELTTANAQLAALRGEVYALRCEIATLSQSLPAHDQQRVISGGN